MPEPVDLSYAIGLPPEDAINYFRQKGYTFSWNWHDVWQDAHAKSFTVAKAMKLDLLQDIRGAVDKALANGTTLSTFRDELEPLLKAKGWWGKDADTGAQLGSGHRLETIFRTNLQSSYMAGRYKQQVENADDRPYWQYISVMDSRTRPAHAELNGKVFRFDDVFWNTHFPPLGFNCRCRTRALTEKQVKDRGLKVETGADNIVWEDKRINKETTRPVSGYKDPKTGKVTFTDPGWSSNPGKTALENSLFQKVQSIYEGCIGKSFADKSGFPCSQVRTAFKDVLEGLQQSFDKKSYDDFVTKVLQDQAYPQNKVLAGYIDLAVYDWLVQWEKKPSSPHIWMPKNNLTHLQHTWRDNKEGTLKSNEIYLIPNILISKNAFWDTEDHAVLYVTDSTESGTDIKIIVRVNYRFGKDMGNAIVSADRLPSGKIIPPRYLKIEAS